MPSGGELRRRILRGVGEEVDLAERLAAAVEPEVEAVPCAAKSKSAGIPRPYGWTEPSILET